MAPPAMKHFNENPSHYRFATQKNPPRHIQAATIVYLHQQTNFFVICGLRRIGLSHTHQRFQHRSQATVQRLGRRNSRQPVKGAEDQNNSYRHFLEMCQTRR